MNAQTASNRAANTISDTEALTRQNFARVSAFIHQYSGIKMPASKRTMLEGRLRRRLRDTPFHSINAYCDHLFDNGGLEAELIHLIDVVTTNKTEFFREPAHFDFMQSFALPALLAEGRKKIKIWSAAASTGAEPYTIAMVMEQFCEARRGVNYSLIGTDICTRVLAQAMAGIYPEMMIEPVPQDLRRLYFMQSRDQKHNTVRVKPHLRSKLALGRLNLMDERYGIDSDLDIIFCRNILIYFDRATQAQVLQRLCKHLRPGGFLFLGHSEAIVGVDLPVSCVAATVFRKDR